MQENFQNKNVGGENNCDCCCGGMCGGVCNSWGFKTAVVVTVFILALFLLSKTVGEMKSYKFIGANPSSSGTITVSGKGEVVAKPDIAEISFTVSNEALIVSEAQDKSSKEMNTILAFLKKGGIEEKDIKTTGYNIYPRYEYQGTSSYYQEGKRNLAAYVVSQNVSLKIRDIARAGAILADLGELGATDLSGLNFTNDKIDDLQKEAKDKAIAEAKVNADKLAKSLGVKLVRILSYSDGNYPVYYAKSEMMATGMGGGATAPEIPSGENKIVSNVSITYEIK
jgi:hypothetical protein